MTSSSFPQKARWAKERGLVYWDAAEAFSCSIPCLFLHTFFCHCLSQQSGLICQYHSKEGLNNKVHHIQYNTNVSVSVLPVLTLLFASVDEGERLPHIPAATVSFPTPIHVSVHFYIHACVGAYNRCIWSHLSTYGRCTCLYGEMNTSAPALCSAYEPYAYIDG